MKGYVLDEDLSLAEELFQNCYDSLQRAQLSFLLNPYSDCNEWLKQFHQAKSNLIYLHRKKLKQDELEKLLSEILNNTSYKGEWRRDDEYRC